MISNLVSATKGQIQDVNIKHWKFLVESTDSAFCLMKKHQNRRTICPQLSPEQGRRTGEENPTCGSCQKGLRAISHNLTREHLVRFTNPLPKASEAGNLARQLWTFNPDWFELQGLKLYSMERNGKIMSLLVFILTKLINNNSEIKTEILIIHPNYSDMLKCGDMKKLNICLQFRIPMFLIVEVWWSQ